MTYLRKNNEGEISELVVSQPDMVMVDKEQKTAVAIDMPIPADCNVRMKEHEKI